MLTYAVKLTRVPWEMVEADVIALRDAGFSDADILDINQITGYYAYVNRLADGLGVSMEAFWEENKPRHALTRKQQILWSMNSCRRKPSKF